MKLIIPDTNSKEFRALLTSCGESDGNDDSGIRKLRGYITPERMTQVALAAIRRTPALLQCRVESLLGALTLCMEAGLEPDGRNAHLLAQEGGVRVVFDWKGLVALGRRAGVEAIHADIVCEQDVFEVSYNCGARLVHKVDYKNPRGEVYAVYCYSIISGDPDIEVMPLEEIERVRTAEVMNGPDDSPLAALWLQDWEAMAKRAVVTSASLKWPLDAAATAALQALGVPEAYSTFPDAGIQHGSPTNEGQKVSKTPLSGLEALRHFMEARKITEASMLDYLKEEGRIGDFVTRLEDVPGPVIEDVVSSWVEMMEEEY